MKPRYLFLCFGIFLFIVFPSLAPNTGEATNKIVETIAALWGSIILACAMVFLIDLIGE